MKKHLTTLMLFVNILVFAQNDWTKEDRNNLYEEYINILSSHKNLNTEQRESIGLCCLETTSTKYSKKEFASKIDIEIKRIRESIMGQCAKNIGVELTTLVQESIQPVDVTSSDWTKADKEQMAKEMILYAEKYEHLTAEQREILSLCYISNVTTKKTKKEYFDMIDIELNKLKQTTFSTCAKSNTIDLENKKNASINTITKANLIGKWKTDQGTTVIFNENGTFTKVFHDNILVGDYMNIENQKTSGDWFMDEAGVLTLIENWVYVETKLFKTKLWNGSANGKFKFETLSKDYFKMSLIEGYACCKEYNKLATEIFQGNKVQ